MTSDGSTVLYGALPIHLKPSAADKRALLAFARLLSARVSHGRPFACLIADDAELRRLNKNFLGNDYPADVLSFPSNNPTGELGDMAISIERAAAQAAEFGHNCFDEIRLLMLHGLLHLIGLDHAADLGEMDRAERHWRALFGLPQTLISRSRPRQVLAV